MAAYLGYFIGAIIVIALAVAVGAARKQARVERSCSDRMNFVVHAPNVYRVVGIAFSAFFGLLFSFCLVRAGGDDEYVVLGVVFGVLLAFGAIFLWRSLRWKLVVRQEEMVFTPTLGFTKTYPIQDITHIKAGRGRVRAYAENKILFWLNSSYRGSSMLISWLIENGVDAPPRIEEY